MTNPGSGLSETWTHDGEEVLILAKKCLDGLSRTISKILEKIELKPTFILDNHLHNNNPLRLKRI